MRIGEMRLMFVVNGMPDVSLNSILGQKCEGRKIC